MRATKILSTFIFCSLMLSFTAASSAPVLLDKIVVEINNTIITESELQKRITDIRDQIQARKASVPSRIQLRTKVLDRMVLDALQLEHAAQFGIRLSKVALNHRIEAIAKQNKITVPQLRATLIKDGIDYEDFRQQVERDTIIRQAQKKLVFDKIKITDREIDQFIINQNKSGGSDVSYHLSHILVAVPEEASSEQIQTARARASKALARLRKGEAFDKLAVEFSGDQKALEGGDLGWRTASELPSLFVSAVSKLNAGEVSDVLQSPSGFHLVKLHEKKNSKQVIVEETLARHILIKVDELTKDDAAREKLAAIRKQIMAGADFAEMARLHSEDTGSKGTGGSLGWAIPGSFVPQFEAVMKSLQKDQISNVFKSPFGWHIIQVLDRRQSDKTNIVVRNKAYQAIQASKADEALELWLRKLRDEAYIKYHNPADAPS